MIFDHVTNKLYLSKMVTDFKKKMALSTFYKVCANSWKNLKIQDGSW